MWLIGSASPADLFSPGSLQEDAEIFHSPFSPMDGIVVILELENMGNLDTVTLDSRLYSMQLNKLAL